MQNFLQSQTVAALKASNRLYSKDFILGASTDGITPVGTGSDHISIQGGHHFFTERVSITYPTVFGTVDDGIVDTGICYQTLLLQTNEVAKVFSSPVLLALIAVPGRQPFQNATPASGVVIDPQPPNIEGFPFNLFLAEGSDFQHTFANTSTTPGVKISVTWQGWDFLNNTVANSQDFWSLVLQYQRAPAVT